MHNFFNNLFTVTHNDNTMYGKIGFVAEIPILNYQSLFFKFTQLA